MSLMDLQHAHGLDRDRLGRVGAVVAGDPVGVVAYSAALREGRGGRHDAANCLA